MDPQWLGLYEVIKYMGMGFYILSDLNNGVVFVKRINGSHLKTYRKSQLLGAYAYASCKKKIYMRLITRFPYTFPYTLAKVDIVL